jgi:hypothetical protein
MQNTSAKRKHQARHQQDFIRKIRCAIGYHQDPQGFANLLGMRKHVLESRIRHNTPSSGATKQFAARHDV